MVRGRQKKRGAHKLLMDIFPPRPPNLLPGASCSRGRPATRNKDTPSPPPPKKPQNNQPQNPAGGLSYPYPRGERCLSRLLQPVTGTAGGEAGGSGQRLPPSPPQLLSEGNRQQQQQQRLLPPERRRSNSRAGPATSSPARSEGLGGRRFGDITQKNGEASAPFRFRE